MYHNLICFLLRMLSVILSMTTHFNLSFQPNILVIVSIAKLETLLYFLEFDFQSIEPSAFLSTTVMRCF